MEQKQCNSKSKPFPPFAMHDYVRHVFMRLIFSGTIFNWPFVSRPEYRFFCHRNLSSLKCNIEDLYMHGDDIRRFLKKWFQQLRMRCYVCDRSAIFVAGFKKCFLIFSCVCVFLFFRFFSLLLQYEPNKAKTTRFCFCACDVYIPVKKAA